MTVLVDGSEITLSGTVGDLWFEDGFTASEVASALATVGHETDVTIRLNSGGGIATEGSAIHAVLSRHKGKVTVVVEGIAASAASVLCMAANEIVMSLGAVMMIHDPANITWGTADDHRRTITELDAIGDATAGIYAEKTGKTVAEARADMKAELWMTAEQAVERGYADRAAAAANDNDARQSVEPSAFDYRVYRQAPQQLVTLSKDKHWSLAKGDRRPTSSATQRQTEENLMPTEKERADALQKELDDLKARQSAGDDARELATLRKDKADRERRDAIMALESAKGREDQAKALADAGVEPEKADTILKAAPAPKEGEDDGEPNPQAYERTRLSGAGLGRGGSQPAKKADLTLLHAATDRTNKRR